MKIAMLLPALLIWTATGIQYTPEKQILGNQICVNQQCYSGSVHVSICQYNGSPEMFIAFGGKVVVIKIWKEYKSKTEHTVVFVNNRGFAMVQKNNPYLIMYCDHDQIIINITHSNFFI
jgi:hypothetical protein